MLLSAYRLKPKLAVFAEACKLERVLVAAVQKALADGGFGKAAAMDGDVALQYLKGLESKQAIAKLVADPAGRRCIDHRRLGAGASAQVNCGALALLLHLRGWTFAPAARLPTR